MGTTEGIIRNTLSKNIKFFRKKKKLTQKELADLLNVKNTTVSSWELGANAPDIETLFLLCDVLGVDINEICGVMPINSQSRLNATEKELIDVYRASDEADKTIIERVAGIKAE